MIKKIKQMFIMSLAIFTLLAPIAVAGVVHADEDPIKKGVQCGVGGTIDENGICDPGPDPAPVINGTIEKGLNLFSAIVGIIAVVMVIVGGVKYITSGGESANVTAAKNTVLYALIGLVIVALAQIIVRFVLQRFVG